MRRVLFLLYVFFVPYAVYATCPDGYVAYRGPTSGYVRNVNGECSALCGAGVTSLNTSTGYKFDLFASPNTAPAIHIKSGDTICYADLVAGASSGTLNVSMDGTTYHANAEHSLLCPVSYTLSYSCGDGATGTPPDSRIIEYGSLFGAGYDYGTCNRVGYYANGWTLDGATKTAGQYWLYNYSSDKQMSVRWTASTYAAAYACNNPREPSNTYIQVSYGNTFTPNKNACVPMFGKILVGYDVQNADGTETGTYVAAGQSLKWTYNSNIRLSAVWETDPVLLETHTLSYSCGSGATGTPPSSRTFTYGQLYSPGGDIGTCTRDGYVFNGWKLDGYTRAMDSYYPYFYSGDKTLTAQWTRPSYAAAYVCNNGAAPSNAYLSATYMSTYTPSTTVCAAPAGQKLVGYAVLNADGTDTGDVVAAGASFQWVYNNNIRLMAIWE